MPGKLWVEQLRGVFASARRPSGLAENRAAVWGVGGANGQRVRAADACGTNGGGASWRTRVGIQAVAPRLVSVGKPFPKELLRQATLRRGEWHYGEELRESAEEQAEGIIAAELKRQRWKEKDLSEQCKGDPFKVRLGRRLGRKRP